MLQATHIERPPMNDRVSVDIQSGVADVRLVRTDKMNALDDAMFSALIETGERLKADRSVRAVVLSGEGRAFCAGLDMGNFGKMASGARKGGDGLVDTPRTESGAASEVFWVVLPPAPEATAGC